MKKSTRHLVSLNTDIVLDIPEGFDPETQEGQDYLRAEFIDFLQSAKYILLSFEIGDKEDDEEDE